MSRVDYCITTMNRPHALERLLHSIAAHRPDASIHVADQSESFDPDHYERLAERLGKAGLRERPVVHRLPFDCGVSVARNYLVESTPSEYKLGLDDDFLFTEQTDIDILVRLLDAHPQAGLVAGDVTRGGRVRYAATRFEKHGMTLCQLADEEPFREHAGIRFKQTDCVPLFTLMRKELFAQVRWDPELKTAGGPHIDFFLCIQDTPYTVLSTPDVTIDHPPTEMDSSYRKLRTRSEFLGRMLAKHRLTRVELVGGAILERGPDGEMTGYCELKPRFDGVR
jgi:hypothetical protein